MRIHGPLWRDDALQRIDDAKLSSTPSLRRRPQAGGHLPRASLPITRSGCARRDSLAFEGFDGKSNPFGIAFFNPQIQEMQRNWWRAALTAKNPFTGLTLLQDPTLAFIEIQNEDSLLFWTFSPYENVPAPQMEILERSFGQWLTAKYGSIEAALASWPGKGLLGRWRRPQIRGDAPAAGRVGLMPIGDLTGNNPRARDTGAFLAEVQRRYYDQMYGYLKKELGFRGSITGSNWITADGRILGPLDKWSNAGCDFMDRHGYFGGPHEGQSASYLDLRRATATTTPRRSGSRPASQARRRSTCPIMDLRVRRQALDAQRGELDPPNRFGPRCRCSPRPTARCRARTRSSSSPTDGDELGRAPDEVLDLRSRGRWDSSRPRHWRFARVSSGRAR